MRLPKEAHQVQQVIETYLPHLSQAELAGLVLWVWGAILAGSVCQNAVVSALSPWGNWSNPRQYLKEWLYDDSDQAHLCMTGLDVGRCSVGSWPGSVTDSWRWRWSPRCKGTTPPPSSSAWVYRRCAIPVAVNRRGPE